jgi:hypothetical protein
VLGASGCAAENPESVGSSGSDLSSCASGTTLRGVDVSSYQGSIDWSSAKSSGIAFGFAKATEGDTLEDSTFAANWAGMKSAGVVRGAYHFFHPSESATAQASFVLSKVGTLEAGDLPIVLDFEVLDGVSEASAVADAVTFLQDRHPLHERRLSRKLVPRPFALHPVGRKLRRVVPRLAVRVAGVELLAELGQRQREWHRGRHGHRRVQRLAVRPGGARGRLGWRQQWRRRKQ